MSSLKACISKKVYYTRYEKRLYFYKCTHCGFYHLSKYDHELKNYVVPSLGIVFRR